ncbi:hypothetical protein [Kallotenue papyrolyticum]|uniref:hypothetical protein n=1 Tax=Kallotenue papyrolyticum TaxID=1325125 RepID=UPI0004786283|nr:hypothetical protein [Kallotenue papyrolyticum]
MKSKSIVDLATLLIVIAIAAAATLLMRALAGYHLQGCLVTFVSACLGAVGGWAAQQRWFGADNLLSLPFAEHERVSVIGATLGALLVALIVSLLGRPTAPRRRRW